jgi:hypothetical protein
MKYVVIKSQRYNENTSLYGYGDYPEQIEYIAAIVEADILRKAQNAVKKIYPKTRFGGMFSPMLLEITDPHVKLYARPADTRLSREAVHAHRAALEELA